MNLVIYISIVFIICAGEMKTLQSLNAQQRAMINLIEANFSQTVQYLRHERDNALKDRDTHHQDAITMRRDNTILKEQLATYTRYCAFASLCVCVCGSART